MTLPEEREELRKRIASGESFQFYLFYGHRPPESGVDASCLSQWFVRKFHLDGDEYATAEHWMMAEKARLFKDDQMLAEILASAGPKEAKAFGRKVRGFDNEVWGEHKYEIVKRGNYAKFNQHDDLKEFLVSTANMPVGEHREQLLAAEESPDYQVATDNDEQPQKDDMGQVQEHAGIYKFSSDGHLSNRSNVILVEAAGRDTVWGIGLGKNNPKSTDPSQWRGLNLLGFALTAVRNQIIQES